MATSIVSAKQAATQQALQYKIIKKQHDMQTQLIEMLTEVAKSAPPPGQGGQVDKSA